MSVKPKQAYKLLKYGDTILTQVAKPVSFPLTKEIDTTIDQCINSLVITFFHIIYCLASCRRFLVKKVNLHSCPSSR